MLGLRRDFGTAIADPRRRDENSKKNGGLLVEIFGRFTFRPLLMLNWVNPMKQNQHIFLINCNKFFFLGQFVAAFWLFLAVFFFTFWRCYYFWQKRPKLPKDDIVLIETSKRTNGQILVEICYQVRLFNI